MQKRTLAFCNSVISNTLAIAIFCSFSMVVSADPKSKPAKTEPEPTIVESVESLTQTVIETVEDTVEKASDENQTTQSVLDNRISKNQSAKDNPFVIAQYRQNYLLPVSYVKDPNPLSVDGLTEENVDNLEAKYQVSVNMPLHLNHDNTRGLYFGFTLKSYWQVYNSELSKPFRENNYEPEIYYQWDADWDLFGYRFNSANIGFNHQSNGQNGLKSRSWNRLYASVIFSDVDSLYYLKAWYRIPEDEKTFALDPEGDDNPDITDFVGRAEFGYAFKVGKATLMTLVRNNLSFSQNRGSVELNATYPLNDRYEWLIQYFNGYGDSLIDYNRHQQRISVGIQLRFL